MSLVTMKEILKDAEKKQYAVGMFNTINLEMVRAIIGAAEAEKSPVILGMAEVHMAYGDLKMLAPIMVKAAKEAKVPVAVHFDHGVTFHNIVMSMHLGFTSVMYDGSTLSYEENIQGTKEIVKIAKVLGVTVESELGHVGGAEGGGDDGHESQYTDVNQALDFVERTGIDALAVAIGTAHGVYKHKPKLDLNRLLEIHQKVNVPLVLHGGSGLSDQDFENCIYNGIRKINIFTDMSEAAISRIKNEVNGLVQISQKAYGSMNEQKQHELLVEEITKKVLAQSQPASNATVQYPDLVNATVEGIKEEIIKKMRLFGSSGRA
ncbi:MAG: class II fructose-bisphosphate aldolase [Hyphomonadaceae bacterium]|nr:class II fructose-bisphosphate aldolase [Clostridia bacterium]